MVFESVVSYSPHVRCSGDIYSQNAEPYPHSFFKTLLVNSSQSSQAEIGRFLPIAALNYVAWGWRPVKH